MTGEEGVASLEIAIRCLESNTDRERRAEAAERPAAHRLIAIAPDNRDRDEQARST